MLTDHGAPQMACGTMTSSARSDAAAHRPPTQNTALILEFSCLYTHDLRRKAKRWQDGFLRFHTFNKRVMVYDVPRNFVGDSHWRERGELADGDELELERAAALVQVGEPIRTTEQDLTALLDKRHKPRGEAAGTSREDSDWSINKSAPLSSILAKGPDREVSSPRATASSNPLRPRTLNALLGTPRGAYGRAVLPSKSPYEQGRRNGVARPGGPGEGPSPKRLRQSADRDVQPAPLQTSRTSTPHTMEDRRPSKPRPRAHKTHPRATEPQVIDLSDSDTPPKAPAVPARSPRGVFKGGGSPPSSRPQKPPSGGSDNVAQTGVRDSSGDPRHELSAPQHVGSKSRSPDLSPKPLRLAPRAARRKLLCQQDDSSEGASRANGAFLDSRSRHANRNAGSRPRTCPGSGRERPASPPPSSLAKFQLAQQTRLDARLSKQNPNQERFLDSDEYSAETALPDRREACPSKQGAGPRVQATSRATKQGPSRVSRATVEQPNSISAVDSVQPLNQEGSRNRQTAMLDRDFDLPLPAKGPVNSITASATRTPTTKQVPDPSDVPPNPSNASGATRIPSLGDKPPQNNATKPVNDPRPPQTLKDQPLKSRAATFSSGIPRSSRELAPAMPAPRPVDNDVGPWSREAFDLFGWNGPENCPVRKQMATTN